MVELDLFKLHDGLMEQGPYSWIVVDGPNLFIQFKELVLKILSYRKYRKLDLCREISTRLDCSEDLLNDILRKKTKWIHLRLIEELLFILQEFNIKEANKYRRYIINKIEWLKSCPRSQQKIKVVKYLNKNLAIFSGAHAADGTLAVQLTIQQPNKSLAETIKEKIILNFSNLKTSKIFYNRSKYVFTFNIVENNKVEIINFLKNNKIKFQGGYQCSLTDGHKTNLILFKELISMLFNISPKIKNRTNKYTITISNKIIVRYLNMLLDFPIGKKSDIVRPPKLIENASSDFKKAFCKGVLQFDGSVRARGTIGFSTKSKLLFNFLENCIINEGIKIDSLISKRDGWCFESKPLKEWLFYFAKNTSKYNRLYGEIYGFPIKVETFEEAVYYLTKAYPKNTNSKISVVEVFKVIKKLQKFNRYQLAFKLKINYKTIQEIINIFLKSNIIKIERYKKIGRINGLSDELWFNENINEWRIAESFVD